MTNLTDLYDILSELGVTQAEHKMKNFEYLPNEEKYKLLTALVHVLHNTNNRDIVSIVKTMLCENLYLMLNI